MSDLPDRVYVRKTTKKGLSAVRPESPLAVETYKNGQFEKLNRVKFIREDLCKTSELKAKIAKDAEERTAMLECIAELAGALRMTRDDLSVYLEEDFMHRLEYPEMMKKYNLAYRPVADSTNALTRAEQFLKGKPE